MFENALSLIKSYDRIIIFRHSNPDGDALGSQIGLKHIIIDNFPEKEVYAVGDAAGRYDFMDDSVMDEIQDDIFKNSLAIILDTSAKSLISDGRYVLAEKTLRIDHHIFCEKIADVEITDTSFESCAGMITALAKECSLTLSPLSAKSLYTGIATDSGRFRYDSTTSETFERTAFLLRQPFQISEIYGNLYADDFNMIKLRAQFILKIKFSEHNVAYIYSTADEMKDYGVSTFTISRGMVGTMSDIRGVDIWVNFTETESGVLCEIRSGKYNINPVAVKYGGGGHAKASGAAVKDYHEAMAMLSDLDKLTEGENE